MAGVGNGLQHGGFVTLDGKLSGHTTSSLIGAQALAAGDATPDLLGATSGVGGNRSVHDVATASPRLWNWDRLRVLSFLDIGAFHMAGQYLFLGVGLPIFLLLRFALASRLPAPESTRTFIHVRVEKLLVPWAAWSLIFVFLKLATGLRHGTPILEWVNPRMILYGPEAHLWFLPFAAVVGIAVHFIDVVTQRVPTRAFLVAFGTSGVAAIWITQAAEGHLEVPFQQWVFGLPAVPLGLGMGRVLARPWADVRGVWISVLAASAVAIGFSVIQRAPGAPVVTAPLRYALAMALISGGAVATNLPGRWTGILTPLLLGGYLLQKVVYMQTAARLERRAGIEISLPILVLITVPLCLLLVAALRRTRLRAIL